MGYEKYCEIPGKYLRGVKRGSNNWEIAEQKTHQGTYWRDFLIFLTSNTDIF